MPSERLKGEMSSLVEEMVKMTGLFRLVHTTGDKDNPQLIIRVYQLIADGKPQGDKIRFKYDARDRKSSVSCDREGMAVLKKVLVAANKGDK